jgi:hypothetical protein
MDPHDPEIKEQSKECRHSGSPRPEKFKTLTSSSMCLLGQTWNFACKQSGKGASIMASFRKASCFKILLLLTRRALCTINWQIFTWKFSPHLVPSDCLFFPNLKCSSIKGATLALQHNQKNLSGCVKEVRTTKS